MKIDKPTFRNVLRNLIELPIDQSDEVNVAMVPQESLDFLAMLAGIKPVCLLGRGLEDPIWVTGVERLAREMMLPVTRGPKWQAEPKHTFMPDWYSGIAPRSTISDEAVYVSKLTSVAEEVQEVCRNGEITMEQEARLLGYPICCVREHYRRKGVFDEALSLMLRRTAGGDEREMKRIVLEDLGMTPEGNEVEMFGEATDLRPAPFTSVNMCPKCASGPESPAMKMSKQYEALARAVDSNFAEQLSP